MNLIEFSGMSFADDEIVSGETFKAMSPPGISLEIGTLTVSLYVRDEAKIEKLKQFIQNDPVSFYHKGQKKGTYYIDSVERTGKYTFDIQASDVLSLLQQSNHFGGMYFNAGLKEVLDDVCTVPYYIQSILADKKIYGWLPIASRRDNLAAVLLAIGAVVKVDRDGVLRIEALWDGIASNITENRIFVGDKIKYSSKVTAVSVTEHQYIKGQEDILLFEGTATDGDLIEFTEPVHSLTAEGFQILESGANYAIISAGTGTLNGKRYTNIKREIKRPVSDAPVSNEIQVKNSTLVGFNNSVDVAERLADYYKYVEEYSASVITDKESVGDVVQITHPYDGGKTEACIKNVASEFSGAIRSDETMLIGYKPPQPDTSGYIDQRIVLTGEGSWQPPEGVTFVRYTIMGGAQGGSAGNPGAPGGASRTYNNTEELFRENGYIHGEGGEGGEGGTPGEGGKIIQGEIDITSADPIEYACGVGGDGSDSPDVPGALGTASVFGGISSDSGTSSDIGYTDPISGDLYAATGKQGISGGKGAGRDQDQTGITPSSATEFLPADGVTDEDGVFWPGGTTKASTQPGETPQKVKTYTAEGLAVEAKTSWGFAGGAAAGSAGLDGYGHGEASVSEYYSIAKATAALGRDGSSATKIPKQASLATGGTGGYGGGGGGASGDAVVLVRNAAVDPDVEAIDSAPGSGGQGAKGGKGGDGVIILYLRLPKATQKVQAAITSGGKWRLDKYGRRCIV